MNSNKIQDNDNKDVINKIGFKDFLKINHVELLNFLINVEL